MGGRVTAAILVVLAAACSGSKGGGVGGADGGGGGGDGGGGDEGGTSAAEACSTRATAYCAKLQGCSSYRMQISYGDQTTCVTRQTANCTASLAAPSTGTTTTTVEACAAAYPGWVCAEFLSDQNIPAGCAQTMGTLAAGAGCVAAGQCTTGYCSIVPGAACGVCATAPTAGASCAQVTTCGPGLDCTTDTQDCVVEGGSGASCGKGAVCASGFSCEGADESKGVMGTCQASLTTSGATCDPNQQTTPACDRDSLLTCNTQTKTCATLAIAGGGQPCGTNDVNDQTAVCGTDGTCTGASTGVPGTCTAAAADGQPCDLVNGPGCLTLSRCIASGDGGTAGTCQALNPMGCQ
ncbi:MAG: hypothetical protein ABSE49_09565 [Polyangiaceae bacterium]|jgi:hypothetical protein